MPDFHQQQGGGNLVYTHHFDRDKENALENSISAMVRTLQEYITRRSYFIKEEGTDGAEKETKVCPFSDSMVIAEIKGMIVDAITLLIKYREMDYAARLKEFEDFLGLYRQYDAIELLKNVLIFRDIVAEVLGDRHNFKDRTEKEFKWEKEIKKKWHLHDFEEKDQKFYDTINTRAKRFAFLASHNMVNCDGDVYMLMTGINNGGKTNTALSLLHYTNWYLRNYWHVKANRDKTVELRPFSLKKDVMYIPAPTDLDELLGDSQYNCKDLNEGMAAAVNLRSMDPQVIRMGVTAFITRAKHNFLIFEYQVAERAPKLLQERFNAWMHKMSLQYAVLSIPSSIYRKEDPLYLAELNKLRKDKDISYWFKYRNPNYVTTLKAPKLSARKEEQFKKYQMQAHEMLKQAREVKAEINETYYGIVRDIWEKVNVAHTLALIELPSELTQINFNESQIKKFMADYNKYDRTQKLMNWSKRSKMQVQEVHESG